LEITKLHIYNYKDKLTGTTNRSYTEIHD